MEFMEIMEFGSQELPGKTFLHALHVLQVQLIQFSMCSMISTVG